MHFNPKVMKIVGIIATLAGFALEFLSDYCKDYCGEIETDDLITKKVSEGIAKELEARKI